MANETIRIEIPIHIGDNTEPGISQATRKLNAFDKANQKTLERLDKMNKTKYQVAIDALDRASSVVQRIGTTVKGLTGKAWSITMKAVDLATAPIRGIINLLKNPIFQIAAITGITIGLKDTIDTFAKFEATMSKVKAISGASASEFEALTAKAKEMGEVTKFTASEAGEAFTYMAMAGWDAEKMLGGISGIMGLAAADGLDLATTSDIVTDALTAFGMAAAESTHLADVLATASSSANTNVSMLGESFKYVAPLAGAMKYSVEDVSMALGLMANAGVKGSMAGTSLKTAIANLAAPTSTMAKTMQAYGISLTGADGSMKSLRDVIGNLRSAFGELNEKQQSEAASTIFGKEAMAGMLAIINTAPEEYGKLAEAIDNAEGAAELMAAIMQDNLSGAFTLIQSKAESVKLVIGDRLKPHLMSFVTWLTDKMPGIKRAAGKAMDFVDEKVKWLTNTINDFTSGKEWEDADIWGKIRIAWDKIIAEPFAEWWSATGKEWFAEKASMIGKGIGTGLTGGLLVLLGVDIAGATEDGLSVGAAFAEGFGEGFDGKKVGEAILGAIKGVFKDAGTLFPGGEKASSTSWLSAGVIGLAMSKLGIFKLIGKGGRGLMDILKGKGSRDGMPTGSGGMPADYSMATMSVSAQVVNVYGGALRTPGGAAPGGKGVPPIIPTGGPSRLPPSGGPPGLPPGGGQLRLPPGGGMPTTTVPQIPGAGRAAAAAGYPVWAPVGKGSSVLVGTAGSSFTAGLANAGYALGSGASTIGGAAAVGGASILGALGGLLGIGSGAVDIYKGAKSADAKEAKDRYWSGGSKIGMVGAGAAAGAGVGALFGGIGAVPGALIGAGIGGVGALFGGSKVGKAMSDATDEGGGMTKFWENTKQRSKDTWDTTKAGAADAGAWVSGKWNEAGDWISNKWGGFSNWLDTTVWTPSKDVGVSAANVATGAWSEGKDWVSGKWGDFSDWLDETVWTPAGHATQIASDWTEEKWDQARGWVGDRWSDFASWLDETAWTPVKGAAQTASQWVVDRWAEARAWTSGHWASLPGWFDESIWTPIKSGAQAAGTWTSEQWNEAGAWIKEAWGTASGWFTETVWEPIKGAALTAGAWISDQFTTAKNAISDAWSGVSGWFEDNVWGPVKSGASAAMKWIEDKWTAAKGWFGGLGQKGAMETGLATSQGKSSVFEHAKGGILTRPHMGIVAEDGPEAIIPLTKPSRAQALWQQVGSRMGFITETRNEAITNNLRRTSDVSENTARITDAKDISETTKRIADVVDITRYQGVGRLSTVKAYAKGGILTRPHMGIVAEDGPEAIIPLTKPSRAQALWQQVGQMLGFIPRTRDYTHHADGGIMTKPHMGLVAEEGAEGIMPLSPGVQPYEGGGIAEDIPVDAPREASKNNGCVCFTVNNKIEPSLTFEIRANSDPDEIVTVIKSRTKEFTDEIGDNLAERLARIFANMPVKGGS
jgi:TP901 family phage tail tape measure protein